MLFHCVKYGLKKEERTYIHINIHETADSRDVITRSITPLKYVLYAYILSIIFHINRFLCDFATVHVSRKVATGGYSTNITTKATIIKVTTIKATTIKATTKATKTMIIIIEGVPATIILIYIFYIWFFYFYFLFVCFVCFFFLFVLFFFFVNSNKYILLYTLYIIFIFFCFYIIIK